jgi:hypothetical protein
MQAGRLRSQLKYFLVIHLNLNSKITKSDFSVSSVSSVVNKKLKLKIKMQGEYELPIVDQF